MNKFDKAVEYIEDLEHEQQEKLYKDHGGYQEAVEYVQENLIKD